MIPLLEIPVWALLVHFIADFIFQSDWMAVNKSKHWDVLVIHVTVYTMTFWLFLAIFTTLSFVTIFYFLGVTWLSHYVTDWLTSRWTSRLWFIELEDAPLRGRGKNGFLWKGTIYTHLARLKEDRHYFFAVIGLDQLLHFTTLALTIRFLFR